LTFNPEVADPEATTEPEPPDAGSCAMVDEANRVDGGELMNEQKDDGTVMMGQ